MPPELSSSFDERIRDRFRPAPEPPLKMKPSSRYQFRIESIESSTDEDEAGRNLLRRGGTDVEPDRRVEARSTGAAASRSARARRPRRCSGVGEVAVVLARLAVGLDDPRSMSCREALLASWRAECAAEVLGGDDRRGVDAPEVGELDALLLEDHLAGLPVGLHHIAALPGHLVIRVDSGVVKTRSMLRPADFRVELFVSDRPFAERVVSVISAFLCRYRVHQLAAWPLWTGCRRWRVVRRGWAGEHHESVGRDAVLRLGSDRSPRSSCRAGVSRCGLKLLILLSAGPVRDQAARCRSAPARREAARSPPRKSSHRPELPIDAGEPEVGNLIELAQRTQNRHPDLVGRYLGLPEARSESSTSCPSRAS